MKKTLIINISNSIVHIEEDAYEILTKYLLGIKTHFSGSADNLEIVTDIENRITELLLDKLKIQNKQVISLSDVEEIKTTMGNVSDFIEDEAEDQSSIESYPKRLFRDTEHKVLGGVTSGLSHYLNLQVGWLRLFFFISLFLGGAGFVIYILLWILIPAAKTAADQMAMRGEAPNLRGFKRNFEEKIGLYTHMGSKSFITQLFDGMAEVVKYFVGLFGKVAIIFFKFCAVVVILTGVFFMLSLLLGVFGVLGFMDGNVFDYFPFNIVGPSYQNGMIFVLFLILFIPSLALVLFSIRYVFNRQVINKTVTYGLLIAWLFAVVYGVYFTAMLTSEFKEHAEISKQVALPNHKEYVLELDKTVMFNQSDSIRYGLNVNDLGGSVVVRDRDNTPFGLPRNFRLKFEPNVAGEALMTLNYQSQGRNFRSALQNAKNIDYRYTVQDNTIHFSPSILLKENHNWRNQEVDVTLSLPIGSRLKVHSELFSYLRTYYWDCDKGEHEDYITWIVTESGVECKHNY